MPSISEQTRRILLHRPSPCHSPSVSLLIGRTELSDSLDDALQQDYLLLHWNRIASLLQQQQRQSAV